MAEQNPEELDFPLPLKGAYQTSALHRVPEGFAAYANNVLPYDCSTGRNTPAQRPGTVKYFPTSGTNALNFGNGTNGAFIQYMGQVNVQDTSAGSTLNKLMIVSGGRAYLQLPTDTSLNRIDGGGAATFSAGRRVSCCTFQNITYFSDGLTVKQYDHVAGTFAAWTASAGTFPIAGSEYARYLCPWRGRMVHAHFDKGSPGILFFSAMNAPRDYDYGSTNGATIAFATNTNFKAGQMGDQTGALIPASEDVLYIGLDHSLYKFVGDPGAGGSLVPVSETIGVLNNDAWCMAGADVYFMSNVGLCKMTPGGEPRVVSDLAFKESFRDLPQVGYYIELEYDVKRSLIWIFVTKEVGTFATIHAVYDQRAERTYGLGAGFWPISFPADTGGDDLASGTTAPKHGPTKSCVFDGGSGTNSARVLLLGGRDGYIRQVSDTALGSDDGTAISSVGFLSLLQPAGATREFLINGHFPVLGTGSGTNTNVTWTLQAGTDPYSASNAASITATGSFSAGGRQSPLGDRLMANCVWLKLSNSTLNKHWAVERWTCRVASGGEVR